jgi:hypothetical protein
MTGVQALVAVAVAAVAVAAALVLRRRRPGDGPTQPRTFLAPAQLDRRDFARPEAEWLVAVFSSASCQTCASMVAKVAVLASETVAVDDVEVSARSELHRRYAIDAVPIVVIADRDGVVRKSFVGPASATDLWAAVAEARDPGSTPHPL